MLKISGAWPPGPPLGTPMIRTFENEQSLKSKKLTQTMFGQFSPTLRNKLKCTVTHTRHTVKLFTEKGACSWKLQRF